MKESGKLPCEGYIVPSIDKFKLEDSPCRKCDLEVCPFDMFLGKLDKELGNLYEYLGMER